MDNNYNSTEWCSFGKNKCLLPFSSYSLLQHLGTIDGGKEEYYFHFSHTSNFNLFPSVKVFISTLRKDATILLESKSLEKKSDESCTTTKLKVYNRLHVLHTDRINTLYVPQLVSCVLERLFSFWMARSITLHCFLCSKIGPRLNNISEKMRITGRPLAVGFGSLTNMYWYFFAFWARMDSFG